MGDSLAWLPAGWIMEIKTQRGGRKAGTLYKCYIDPITGYKFYSKQEVFRYLKTGKTDHEAPQPKRRRLNLLSADNVVSRIEKSPDGLPPGWTKETKFRKRSLGKGFRKDPYYTDPVTGYVFRSKRGVFRYLETGNVGIHASKPNKTSVAAKNSTDNKLSSPVTANGKKLSSNSARRCLFESRSLNVSGVTAERITGSTVKQEFCEDVDPTILGCTKEHPKTRKGKRFQVTKSSSVLEEKLTESRDKKLLENRVILKSRDKNQSLMQNASLSELEANQQGNELLLEARNRKLFCNGVPLESGDNNETGVKLEMQDGKPSDDWVLMESEETKKQIENQTSEMQKHLVQNTGMSELEDETQGNGVFLGSRNKQSENEVPPESGCNKQTENGEQSKLLDRNPSVNTVLVVSDDTKLLENRVQLEAEAKTLPEGKSKTERARVRSSKMKAERVTLLPRRASKRLAGLEAEVALDITSPERSHRMLVNHLTASRALESTPSSSVADQVSEQCKQLQSKQQVDPSQAAGSTPSGGADEVSEQYKQLQSKQQVDPSHAGGSIPSGGGANQVSEQCKRLQSKQQVDPSHAGGSIPSGGADQVSEPCKQLQSKQQVDPCHAEGSIRSGGADQVSEQSEELKFNLQADHIPCTPQVTKGAEVQPEKPLMEKLQVDEKPVSPFNLPFGDSWLDPCLEFAFKTLTGDIPVAMDTTAIEDYFQQQLGGSHTPNLSTDDVLQSEFLFQPSKDMVVPIERGKTEEGKHR